MENLLRKSYEEREIIANTIKIKQRAEDIRNAIDGDILSDDDITELAYRFLDMQKFRPDMDHVLNKLEEIFCKNDENYSKGQKETGILAGIIVCEYCKKQEDPYALLIVICGRNMGKRPASEVICNEIEKSIFELRKSWRRINQLNSVDLINIAQENKNEVLEEIKAVREEEGREIVITSDMLEMVFKYIETSNRAINTMVKNQKKLKENLSIQREELDVLWWLQTEWSDLYNKPLRELSPEEAAAAVPFDLIALNQYILGSVSIKKVLFKALSVVKNLDDSPKTLKDVIEYNQNFPAERIPDMELEPVQPILGAFKCMNESKGTKEDGSAWKSLFLIQYKMNPDELKWNVRSFAENLYLELELLETMKVNV